MDANTFMLLLVIAFIVWFIFTYVIRVEQRREVRIG